MIIGYKRILVIFIIVAVTVIPLAAGVSFSKWTVGQQVNASLSIGKWSSVWGHEAAVTDWIKNQGDKNMGVVSSVDDPENAFERENGSITNFKRWYKLKNTAVGMRFQVFSSGDFLSDPVPIKCAKGQYIQRLYADAYGKNPIDADDARIYGEYKHIRDSVGDDLNENGSWKINNQVYEYVRYLGNGFFEVVKDLPLNVSETCDLMIKITLVLNGFSYVRTVDICSFEQYFNNKTGL